MDIHEKPKEDSQAALCRLAALSPFEYEQVRQKEAEKLGVRVTVLDNEVKNRRPKPQDGPESRAIVEEIEPWDEPVNAAEILDEIKNILQAYLVMEEAMFVACALWVILSYTYDSFRILPLLGITSPEKRCGKTKLLEALHGLVKSPLLASNISPSAVYRVIERYHPCLLIDEADTFTKNNHELQGIINSGHTRASSSVVRVNPETLEPESFSTWGPKAIAMIGRLSGTNRDRSIEIRLKRKMPGERVTRLPLDLDLRYKDLRRKCARWAQDHIETLKNSGPDLPDIDNDRAVDNWTPLFCIAACVGGKWPEAVRRAMLTIEAGADTQTIRQELLADIRVAFGGRDRIGSKDLIEKLIKMEDRPWCDWRHGTALTQTGLARLLKPFGIISKSLRFGDKTAKGYDKKQFEDVFGRYLPSPAPALQSVTTAQIKPGAGFPPFPKRNTNQNVADQKPWKVNGGAGCAVVTDGNSAPGGEGMADGEMNLFEGVI